MNPVAFALHVQARLILIDDLPRDERFFERRFNGFKDLVSEDDEALDGGNGKAMTKEIFKNLTHASIGQQLYLAQVHGQGLQRGSISDRGIDSSRKISLSKRSTPRADDLLDLMLFHLQRLRGQVEHLSASGVGSRRQAQVAGAMRTVCWTVDHDLVWIVSLQQ